MLGLNQLIAHFGKGTHRFTWQQAEGFLKVCISVRMLARVPYHPVCLLCVSTLALVCMSVQLRVRIRELHYLCARTSICVYGHVQMCLHTRAHLPRLSTAEREEYLPMPAVTGRG